MGKRTTGIVKKLKSFKRDVSKTVPINKLIFFGSRTKGTYKRDSDIDLVVVSQRFKGLRFRRRPLILYDSWKLNYPVDFLCYTPEEFKRMKKLSVVVGEAVKGGIEI